ncbi:MAG: hypothetical protein RMK18_12840, partial [Armatimonadota bacterium]|nr:hypothetical protein [Armatimonadota bacterium]
ACKTFCFQRNFSVSPESRCYIFVLGMQAYWLAEFLSHFFGWAVAQPSELFVEVGETRQTI